jgi:isopenicillin N synthase-like dioxygenase
MQGVQTVDYHSPRAAEELVASFRQTGFAVLKNHPLDARLVQETYAEWKKFFENVTEEERLDFLFDQKSQAGYFPFGSEKAKDSKLKDLKAFYHFYPWQKKQPKLAQATPILFDKLSGLAAELLNWIEAKTPKEVSNKFAQPLSQMIEKSQRTLFRIIYYPALKGDEQAGAIRAAEHEDINLITLLPAATANGLQVKDIHGVWHDVDCSDANSLVINVGDMLQMASGGYYPSTTHRVVNPEGNGASKARYSMPLFLHPADDVALSEKHTAKSYLEERLRELGLLKS